MLTVIWTASLALSSLSFVVMVVLVARRAILDRHAREMAALRRQLLSALVRFSGDGDKAALQAILAAAPPRIVADASTEFLALIRGDDRDAVVAALRDFGLPAFLAKELKAGSQPRRIHAAEMLAAFPSDATVSHLQDALAADPSREVRLAAAIALAELQALPPLSPIMARLGAQDQYSWRLNALFRHLPAERAQELEAVALGRDMPEFVRSAAIDALVPICGLQARRQFERLAADRSPTVAAAAVRALGYVGDSGASAVLTRALESAAWAVRAEAAEAAGRLGDAALLDRLAGLLSDPVWAVRYAAAKALRQMGAAGELRLQQLVSSGPPRSQRTASLVLAEGVSQ